MWVVAQSTGIPDISQYPQYASLDGDPLDGDDSYQGIIPPPDGWENYNRSDWNELNEYIARFDRSFQNENAQQSENQIQWLQDAGSVLFEIGAGAASIIWPYASGLNTYFNPSLYQGPLGPVNYPEL